MADVDLKLSERADSAANCVFCREALDDAPFTCPGCDVGLHAACRDELSRCPTLGCAQSWQPRGRVRLADEPTRPEPRAAVRPADVAADAEAQANGKAFIVVLLLLLLMVWLTYVQSRPPESVVRARERQSQRVDEAPLAAARARKAEAERAQAEAASIGATPLLITRDEDAVWRTGTLHRMGGPVDATQESTPGVSLFKALNLTDDSNGLSVEEARWIMAGVRQRGLAALPRAAADGWAQHAVGSSGRVRVDFDHLEPGRETRTRSTLEATITLMAIHAESIELRVAVEHGAASVSWLETWPRAVGPALRCTVVNLANTPASTSVVQGVTRRGRAITANADGVTVQVLQEDALPLPWHVSVVRGLDTHSYRVTLELISFSPAAR